MTYCILERKIELRAKRSFAIAYSVIELAAMPAENPDWLIDGFLTRGNTAFMIGQPKKALKSWMFLAAAWDMSEGRPIWGIFNVAHPMRVVYFTQEDTKQNIHDRVMAHVGARRELSDRLWIVPKNLDLKFDIGLEKIKAELVGVKEKAGDIDLILFDPLANMMTGNENDSQTISGVWTALYRLQEQFNCGTMIAHHIRKPPQKKDDYDPTDPFIGRGSSAIYGGGDAFATVVPLSKNKEWGEINVYFESKRASTPDPACFRVNFGTGQVEHKGAPKETRELGDI